MRRKKLIWRIVLNDGTIIKDVRIEGSHGWNNGKGRCFYQNVEVSKEVKITKGMWWRKKEIIKHEKENSEVGILYFVDESVIKAIQRA